jgi:hypothetical protein
MADTTDNHKLIVSLEARMRSYEKAIERAQGQTNARMKGIETALRRPQKEMEKVGQAAERMQMRLAKVGGVIKSFGAGLLGGLAAGGITGVVSQFGAVAESVARIGDEAKRAGVDSSVFQEWTAVATKARIPVDAMIDGLKEMALRGDEFAITGKGAAAEAFARLGYGAAELKTKLEDPSALLLEIIDRLGKFDKAAQIRISDELFGGSAGERFVELIDQGAAGIRRTIDEAHALGNILDDDVIARAAEVDRQFKIVSQTVGTALKSAIVDAASALSGFIDSFNSFENQRRATLTDRSTDIDAQRLSIENRILEAQANAALNDRTRAKAVSGLRIELEKLNAESAKIEGALAKTAPVAAPGTSFKPPAYVAPPVTGGGGRDASAAAAEREAEAVRRLIAELEFERSLIGMTEVERETAVALRQAGAAATDEQRAKIGALISEIDRERAALDALKAAQEAAAEAGEWAGDLIGDALLSIIDKSSSAEDALKRLVLQLALAAAQAVFLGSGPLAGILGLGRAAAPAVTPALAPAVAGTGIAAMVSRGDAAMRRTDVGEMATHSMRGMTSRIGAASSASDNRVFNIDARGAQRGVGEEIRAALKEYDKSNTVRVAAGFAKARQRRMIR